MHVQFSTTAEEYVQSTEYVYNSLGPSRLARHIASVFGGMCIGSVIGAWTLLFMSTDTIGATTSSMPGRALILLTIGLLLYVGLHFYQANLKKSAFQRVESVLPMTLSVQVEQDKLVIDGGSTSLSVAPGGLFALTEDNGNVYLFTSPVVAYLVPSHVFQSAQDRALFIAAASGFVHSTRDA